MGVAAMQRQRLALAGDLGYLPDGVPYPAVDLSLFVLSSGDLFARAIGYGVRRATARLHCRSIRAD